MNPPCHSSCTVATARQAPLRQYIFQKPAHQHKGALESKIAHLIQFYKAAATFDALHETAGRLAADMRESKLRIEAKHQTQVYRPSLTEEYPSDNAVCFLRADLPSEEHFEVAQKVTVDVGVNSIAVDGRNLFSASQVTFLKNAVHFTFLFSSLNLDFYRYPRVVIFDNIEVKGVVAGRSQKLQRLIVRRSSQFDLEDHIIITTSMIAREVNSATYCVSDKYTHDNKSLQL